MQRGELQLRGRVRRWTRRLQTRRRYGSQAVASLPIVFGNAIPKNGSKLLFNILRGGLPEIGPFTESGMNAIKPYMGGRAISPAWLQDQLSALQPGDVRVGYLHATPENLAAVCHPDWAVFQIVRDPRDVVVSGVFYALEVHPNHLMREAYAAMDSPETRITTAIQGIPGGKYQFADIRTIYERYMGWLENPEVCLLHFEDLIATPEQQLNRVIDHLQARGYEPQEPRQTLLDTLIRQMDPSKSPTFRQGKSGGWREHFTPVHKALFKDLAGDLLIRLGYEKDLDW